MDDEHLLVLVNKDNKLPENYEANLVETEMNNIYVDAACADALAEMLRDGRREGLNLVIASGYRSSERQQEILDSDIKKAKARGMSDEEAYEEATKQVMPPGYSEHETGLAVDIAASYHQTLDDLQARTPENIWLREHCSNYGFILRYPEDKEGITGIDYESWHFRYVGVEYAKDMEQNGQTLEEYLGMLD